VYEVRLPRPPRELLPHKKPATPRTATATTLVVHAHAGPNTHTPPVVMQGGGPRQDMTTASSEKKAQVVSVVGYNVCGLKGRMEELRMNMVRGGALSSDVVAVVETKYHTGEAGEYVAGYEWDGMSRNVAAGSRSRNGVGAWLREGADITVMERHERYMWLRVSGHGAPNTYIAVVYAPVQDSAAAEVEEFWRQLSHDTQQWACKGDVVVMGDLNGRVGAVVGDTKVNTNGTRILTFCEQHDMVILNTAWAYGKKTWRRGGGSAADSDASIIDYVLVQSRAQHRVHSMRVIDGDFSSDHLPIALSWNTGRNTETKKKDKKKRMEDAEDRRRLGGV
jgi:exonuclease III